jgi:hypothetical protein
MRTVDIVEATFVTLAGLNTVMENNVEQGTGLTVAMTLNAAQDAADRVLLGVADNLSTSTFTPEAGYTEIGTTLSGTSPTTRIRQLWNDTTFDTSPGATFAPSVIYIAAATELEQPGVFTAPPPGAATIDVELILAGYNTTDQTADYDTSSGFTFSVGNGSSFLAGNNRMAIVDVITTTGTSVDPGATTLTGGGMTSWDIPTNGSRIVGTSTNRSRITRFIGWQATSGAAAPLVIGVGGQATTGVQILAVRTPVTDATQFALAKSTTKKRYYLDTSESASGPAGLANDPLAVPGVGSIVYAVAMWNSSLATIGTIVPESGLTEVASTGMGSAPARQMYAMKSDPAAYDRSPSCTWGGTSINWGFIASELGQV